MTTPRTAAALERLSTRLLDILQRLEHREAQHRRQQAQTEMEMTAQTAE